MTPIVAFLALAQTPPTVVPLWPGGVPGFESRREEKEVAKDWWVKNIHNPSITAFLPPKERATGAAVIVAPGGGHRELVFDAEGRDAAVYLNSIGVAAFVLKYRLAREEGSPYKLETCVPEDAYRAIRLVRSRAAEWGVDPSRVGMLGFSAGGEVVSMVAYGKGDGDPNAADPVDRLNGKPNFQMLVYPGPLGLPATVPADAPPAFFVTAIDDASPAGSILALLHKFRAAKVPAEAHIYAKGGHAFNMGQRSTLKTLKTWPQRMADWLEDNEWLKKRS
ncbi:MAG: alpha/beta hydrolase [Fimbriimonas sp.]